MKKRLFLLAVIAAGYFVWKKSQPLPWPDSFEIQSVPSQSALSATAADFDFNGFRIQPLATFDITARVLSTRRYSDDDMASIIPIDVALGWGPMSTEPVLKQITISQSERFFWWEYQNSPPIPREAIISHASNMHLIASNDDVKRNIQQLRRNDQVHFGGKLVRVTAPNGQTRTSSLRRDDSGPGACEIVWVEYLNKLPTPSIQAGVR